MKKYQLGEFEEIVLLTVGILDGDAYGVTIKDEIEDRLKREVSVGALSGFAERIDLSWWYFVLAAVIALVVSWLAVALKTLKAARVSVLRGLREE